VLVVSFVPLRTLLPAYSVAKRKEGELRLHFLSVGQGDSTIVEFPDGEIVIVDAGNGSYENENHIYRYLKALQPTAVSIVVTHAESDHFGGFARICKDFPIERAYLPALSSSLSVYSDFLESVSASGAEQITLLRRVLITNPSGAFIACISPNGGEAIDRNEDSAVLYVSYQGVNALLAGDIGEKRESALLREYAVAPDAFDYGTRPVRLEDTHILKVSHHGSASSSSEEWLKALGAEVAVVSSGKGNSYAHPAADAMQRLSDAGAQIYRTDELNDIMITVADGGIPYRTRTEKRYESYNGGRVARKGARSNYRGNARGLAVGYFRNR
ncbi:MAG: MBL fold metallo-hydrolase, partial [Clostridia bacterium]|nr:MBL fold metallo-hydrolase [Clostridia bacterium]